MADMLVRLYALPDVHAALTRAREAGVAIRRAEAWERTHLIDWVGTTFSPRWTDEVAMAFASRPASCFVGLRGDALVGFACHDCTRPNFFGPAGVKEEERGRGVGAALALAALDAMRAAGYAYAIVGGVGPASFYERVAGAVPIADSTPGIYARATPGSA